MFSLINITITIISAIIAIFSVILIHEFGHFVVAKCCGVKVLRFSIGFGKTLCSWRSKSGTQYVLGILPLGGYVKMLGEDETEITAPEELRHAYHRQSLWVRIAIVVAGPLTNFLLAIVLYWIVFMGDVVHVKPTIAQVTPNSIAAMANIQVGDEIVAIDNHPATSWQRILTLLVMRIGDKKDVAMLVRHAQANQLQLVHLSLQNWVLNPRNPSPLESLGIVAFQPKIPAIVGRVLVDSPAAQAGIKAGDQILAFDQVKISNWDELMKSIRSKPGQKVLLQINRNQQQLVLPITVGVKKGFRQANGYLGIYSRPIDWPKEMLTHQHYNALSAWWPAVTEVAMTTYFNATVLIKMITGKISLHMLGGPIMIFHTAGQASQVSLTVYLSFIAFISVTLGFINLLPIPGLDGGHLLFHIIEAIFGKPIPEQYQRISILIGFSVLIFLMIQATLNDILRLL